MRARTRVGTRGLYFIDAMDEATLAIVRDELKRRDDDYEAATGIKSSREIIAQDAEWEATYQRLKHAELKLAVTKKDTAAFASLHQRTQALLSTLDQM